MRLKILIGACGMSLLAGSAFAAGLGGGGGHGGGMGGGGVGGGHMGGGHMGGGGMHMGGGAMHAGGASNHGFEGGRGGFRGGGFARRGFGIGGYGYDGDYGYDYGYNDPAYGLGDNGDGVQTGRSAAEGGSVCETPVTTCQLGEASYVGQPCSCEADGGSSRGRIAR